MDQRWSNNNTRPYWQVAVSLMFSILATVAFVFIGWKLIIFLMPFVIGWLIALIITPIVRWLEKRLKIVKKLASVLTVVLVLGLFVVIIYFAVSRLVSEVNSLIQNFPTLYSQLESGLNTIGDGMSGLFSRLPKGIQDSAANFMANLDQYVGNLMSNISEPTVEWAGNFAKSLPSFLIGFIVTLMSAYLFTAENDQVSEYLHKMAPPSVEKRMSIVFQSLRTAVGGYFKAQFKIMGIVFAILLIAFAVMGVHYSVLVALLIAFLDFLPFFGTGTAMIPWAIYKFLVGDYKTAIILLVIYGITQAAHQLLQPKLIGDSVGLNPIVTLLLLYIGYRVSSVIGMILAVPIGMVLINMIQAGAFDYIIDDVRILVEGILGLREDEGGD
ncbi:MAG: sporulation integral membrane protein YtvI [Hespellia sp.]|nr:sporulation integral membrane protein YtvI [Hespellia sp.]